MKWAYGPQSMAPSPSVGAIPLNFGAITLRWERKMLFNQLHVTLSCISKITISILPCVAKVLSSPVRSSDKSYAETMPTNGGKRRFESNIQVPLTEFQISDGMIFSSLN